MLVVDGGVLYRHSFDIHFVSLLVEISQERFSRVAVSFIIFLTNKNIQTTSQQNILMMIIQM